MRTPALVMHQVSSVDDDKGCSFLFNFGGRLCGLKVRHAHAHGTPFRWSDMAFVVFIGVIVALYGVLSQDSQERILVEAGARAYRGRYAVGCAQADSVAEKQAWMEALGGWLAENERRPGLLTCMSQ